MPLPAHLSALRALIAGAIAALAPLAAADAGAGIAASVLTATGGSGSGPMHIAGGSSVTVGSVTTALDGVVDLQFTDSPAASTRRIDQGLVLLDGEVLRGVTRSLEQGKLSFASDSLGLIEFDAAQLSVIAFGAFPVNGALSMGAGAAGAYFPNGESSAGVPQYINAHQIGMAAGGRVHQFPRERIQWVVLRPAAPVAGTWISLVGGDRLGGTLSDFGDSQFHFQTSFGRMALPTAGLQALWSQSPALQALDALPMEERHEPAIEAVAGAITGGIVPAAGSGDGARHGIIQAAGSHLRYAAISGWTALVGRVRAVSGSGAASCSILVDGKPAFRSAALRCDQADEVYHVPLSGAHELVLEVASADGAPMSVLWSLPTLVK